MKANSWHGRLALHYGPLYLHALYDIDICSYTRAVINGAMKVALITAGLAAVALMALSTIFHIFFYVVYGFVLMTIKEDLFVAAGMLIPMIAAALALVVAIYFTKRKIDDILDARRDKRDAAKRERGFVEQAAEAHLGKFCFKLSFSDIGTAPAPRRVDDFDSRF